ncbi:hypothetical protein LguiA_015897 [Lonicera macranthoides]
MQQQGGRSQYGASPFAAAAATTTDPISQQQQQQLQLQHQQQRLGDPGLGAAEEASPISSRPPAGAHLSSAGNFDEHLLVATGSGGLPDDDALGGDETDRGGGSGGNRWPRQETLALLKIRSDMDATFRDATLKGPLWEDVSRKLAELGYKRSAKKCKEKFENVHKYYKRTKEGRAGRQDGKSYRFFSQLEALHTTIGSSSSSAPPLLITPAPAPAATTIQFTAPVPVPMTTLPVSSVRLPTPLAQVSHNVGLLFNPDSSAAAVLPGTAAAPTPAVGVSFSSDSMSSSSGSDEMDDEDDEMDLEPNVMEAEPSNRLDRKRKRGSSRHSVSSSHKMMEFFESLMKQVMQKQEALQQRFLEAIEKREQDRMIREEAWKRQEMARLAREHDLMAQERAISASRDAAIIAFLQKITGQTIQLPPAVNIPAAPPPPPPPQVAVPIPPSQPPPLPQSPTEIYQKPLQQQPPQHHSQQLQLQHHQNPQTSVEVARKHQSPMSMEIVVAVPEQQVALQEMSGGGVFEAASSRWPKAEVLALIKLRSGLEPRYQEAGPKGPLWEEISAGMHRMGYKRNPKRCKEKWENINKYFKKVKESNKKRPEDAKTCPYFHELDALYRKKILGGTPGTGVGSSSNRPEDQPQQQQQQQQNVMMDPKFQERGDIPAIVPSTTQTTEQENRDVGGSTNMQTNNGDLTATLFGEGSDAGGAGVAKKPEDILKEQQHQSRQQLTTNDFDKIEEPESDMNLDQDHEEEYNDDDDDDDDDDDGDEEAQEEMKMAYKIQFQRPNAGSSSNGGGNGTASFLAMVQ